jgi:hypothetical protein
MRHDGDNKTAQPVLVKAIRHIAEQLPESSKGYRYLATSSSGLF